MTIPWPGRDDGEVEAILVDRYLDSLLARRPSDVTGVGDDVGATALRLVRELPRYHPSFVFEERLAERLTALARELKSPLRLGGATNPLVPLPTGPGVADAAGPGAATSRPVARPVVIGGVLTSAALSIAGAAFVAWRLRRPTADPMSRAVRAITRTRIA